MSYIIPALLQIKTATNLTIIATLLLQHCEYDHDKARFNITRYWIHTGDHDQQTKNITIPDSKVHGANMGPFWGRQDPGGPHVGPMNLAIRESTEMKYFIILPHGVGGCGWGQQCIWATMQSVNSFVIKGRYGMHNLRQNTIPFN